jgi:hypothetical protein
MHPRPNMHFPKAVLIFQVNYTTSSTFSIDETCSELKLKRGKDTVVHESPWHLYAFLVFRIIIIGITSPSSMHGNRMLFF